MTCTVAPLSQAVWTVVCGYCGLDPVQELLALLHPLDYKYVRITFRCNQDLTVKAFIWQMIHVIKHLIVFPYTAAEASFWVQLVQRRTNVEGHLSHKSK